ncbi:MAG: c-type cytochrome [Tistlia sp.]|uniref:cytochrome c n=1 Tax=Tistlia sp. TaxID=3057121 RepID=UPI0034A37250
MSLGWKAALAAAVLAGAGLAVTGSAVSTAAADPAQLARGAYLARIMDCGGCHTPGAMTPEPDLDHPLSGGTVGFRVGPLGVFFPPNLTSDPATGLGAWSAAEIEAALRQGLRPDGRELAPIMPWRAYAALEAEDMAALVAYLQSLPPVSNQVPEPVAVGAPAPLPYLDLVLPN